jgi:hypothetical protein
MGIDPQTGRPSIVQAVGGGVVAGVRGEFSNHINIGCRGSDRASPHAGHIHLAQNQVAAGTLLRELKEVCNVNHPADPHQDRSL